jgi:threonine/homoserine/homoserine lactone efflux protein
LTNPLTIVFWSSLFGTLIASGKLQGTTNDFIYSLGCVTATIFFLGLVATGGACLSSILSERRIRFLNLGIGLFLICFGLSMLLPLCFWSHGIR